MVSRDVLKLGLAALTSSRRRGFGPLSICPIPALPMRRTRAPSPPSIHIRGPASRRNRVWPQQLMRYRFPLRGSLSRGSARGGCKHASNCASRHRIRANRLFPGCNSIPLDRLDRLLINANGDFFIVGRSNGDQEARGRVTGRFPQLRNDGRARPLIVAVTQSVVFPASAWEHHAEPVAA